MVAYREFKKVSEVIKGWVTEKHPKWNDEYSPIDLGKRGYDDHFGIILKNPKPSKTIKHIAVLNADGNMAIQYDDAHHTLGLSFICVARLVFGDDEKVEKVFDALYKGRLVIVDYVNDHYIPLTPKEVKDFENNRLVMKPGYTLFRSGKEWHRSGTVLLRHGKKMYLIGQDEGTYFGVELAGRARTIDEAYRNLMPVFARGKTDVLRQGEWFFVPVSVAEIPYIDESVIEADTGITLPRESDDSNVHDVEGLSLLHFSPKGLSIYVKDFTVRHDDHASINARGWHKVVKNTAVRSVSVEGVD